MNGVFEKFVLVVLGLVCFCFVSEAQPASNDLNVTKFLGIPVDGYKSDMIRELEKKGYQYDRENDCLFGEYNGEDVIIAIQTNNNKVWRIAIADVKSRSEAQIKIRYNNLCKQFENNKKYGAPIDHTIPDKEDISYEMIVHNKEYQAAYLQNSRIDTVGVNSVEKLAEAFAKIEGYENRLVWFTINQRGSEYAITMFYENGYNQAKGEDL